MRVEIAYKFIMGFIIVVGSIVVLDLVVPLLGVPEQMQQLVSLGGAILVGLILGSLFSKAFTGNIKVITGAAERISHGDLSQPIRLKASSFPDEMSDLAESLNKVNGNLRELVGKVRDASVRVSDSAQGLSATSEEMTASSHELSNTVEQISRGAEVQAETVEKASRLIKEFAINTELVASSSKKVSDAVNVTVQTAQGGGEKARHTMDRMMQLLQDVERSGEQVVNFGDQLGRIGKIVEVINGIAQKTNLLALNATIEAARAGEYGRGFAVVAEEIRKLADSTTGSADEITNLIAKVQDEGQNVEVSLRNNIAEMDEGRKALELTNQAFEEIIDTAVNTQVKSSSIAELSKKQIEGADKMVQAIENISQVVSDNAAATEEGSAATEELSAAMGEMAHSAQELASYAEALAENVKEFQFGGEEAS
ncbi:MAG: methyl-accepting chemotaxis protein [Desulfuromonas sp.]|nr:MAG: methyl-accepting chemotaxis protein [Desulfuromonas sp.]